MDYSISFVLGIIEGLTEFLPVSSTAHLRIAEGLFHLPLDNPFWKTYTIVIQLGAILALPVYFWGRIRKFISTYPHGEFGNKTWLTHPLGLTMVGFVVTAIPAFLLTKIIGKNLESLTVIGAALLIGGAVMWAVDAVFGTSRGAEPAAPAVTPLDAMKTPPAPSYETPAVTSGKIERMEDMTLVQAVWIGAVQILSAVFPGTSRSMATIAAGQTANMTRSAALEYSFFLSIPTMAAATLYALFCAIHPKHGSGEDPFSVANMHAHQWIVMAIGLVISFVVALGSVAWFMAWVRRRGFAPFAIYRIILGVAVLLWARSLHG